MMDHDTWEIIIEQFEDNPGTAFIFAQFLHVLKEQIESGKAKLVAESLQEGLKSFTSTPTSTRQLISSICLPWKGISHRSRPDCYR